MTFHRDLTLDNIHTIPARIYSDIAVRDAATDFHVTNNLNKIVRVDSPVGYHVLVSINPAVWLELSVDSILKLLDTPSSYTGATGKVVQVNTTADALEFGQALRISDSPTFEGLSVIASFNVECNANLNAGLFVSNDSIFSATVDIEGSLNVNSNIITLNNVGTPTDVTADQGGIIIKGDTDKTIIWTNSFDAWLLNQNVIVNNQLSVGAAGPAATDASIDLIATNKALLHNRMTTTQRDALTAVAGMAVYNTTTNDLEYRTNTIWKSLSGPQDLAIDANPTFNDLTLTGDLTVQGTTTTIDSTTLIVEDKNIELGSVTTPTDITADGGGITLKGTTDKTITWSDATNAWTFNEDIDAGTNIIKTTGVITGGSLIATTQVFGGNILLSGNTISSANANGNINLIPNGTGRVVVDDLISAAGGVFKFTLDAIRAGLDAVEFVEMGHGGGNGFINAVGDGGLDFRFEGATLATFTDFGHLHLLTNVDQKHTLKIVTANNLNDTGIAWENSGGSFTHTIFRTDVGTNRADLIFAAGLNANIDLLTNSFKIHGAAGVEGKLEVLGALQISSGTPALDKVLTSDANGIATWQTLPAGLGGWIDDGTVVRLATAGDNVGIGTASPDPAAKLEIAGQIKITGGNPGDSKRLTSDATGLAAWTEDLGTVVAQETFASTNVRFLGELALPAAQGWIDTATGSATIDLFADTVFGEPKQVVRHNDNVTNGSTTSKILLTTQNWLDINTFGASYGGTARLDAVTGTAGFFSGLQANSAENPLATGNRRYGLTFSNSGGNLNVSSAGGSSVIMDGTSGNPLVPFDKFFLWECVVPSGLGAAELFINKILTTLTPAFNVNTGGLGTQVLVSSGSTTGVSRVTYHDNFGVTIFEETATKTLLAATMAGDVAQINIPEGKRDYTIILPDGNPRAIGATLRLVANNVLGLISLENQNPAAPEILYNGLRTLVLEIAVKEIIGGINTVDQGNVYLGFKDEDIDRAESIFAQLSSSVDQVPVDTNPTVITYNTQDEINGIGHSTSLNPGELEILPGFGGVYFVQPQSQVGKDSGATKTDFDMFWQIDRGSGFVDEPNSNIKLTIKDSDITDVIVSGFTIPLNVGDKIRMMQRVSSSTVGLGLKNTDAEVGPPTVPRTPSIILAMFRVGGV